MPKETFTIDPVRDISVGSINGLVVQLNNRLSSIALALAQLEGRDGFSPKMKADLNLDGHRLLNVGSISTALGRQIKTDRAGGQATDETIPDPADAPGTADALRDDLVANTLPVISSNFTDHADKINKALDALKNAGLL